MERYREPALVSPGTPQDLAQDVKKLSETAEWADDSWELAQTVLANLDLELRSLQLKNQFLQLQLEAAGDSTTAAAMNASGHLARLQEFRTAFDRMEWARDLRSSIASTTAKLDAELRRINATIDAAPASAKAASRRVQRRARMLDPDTSVSGNATEVGAAAAIKTAPPVSASSTPSVSMPGGVPETPLTSVPVLAPADALAPLMMSPQQQQDVLVPRQRRDDNYAAATEARRKRVAATRNRRGKAAKRRQQKTTHQTLRSRAADENEDEPSRCSGSRSNNNDDDDAADADRLGAAVATVTNGYTSPWPMSNDSFDKYTDDDDVASQ